MEKINTNKTELLSQEYNMENGDFESISDGLSNVLESGLIDQKVLENLRIVSFDSKFIYVFTKGEHISNGKFTVGRIKGPDGNGFFSYKIKKSNIIGKNKDDYRNAKSWFLSEEIESTASDSQKFDNENSLYKEKQPKKILDVILLAPKKPFENFHNDNFDYLTDVIFHEVGHIEQRRFENWKEGSEPIKTFISDEGWEKFKSVIEKTDTLPKDIIDLLLEKTGRKVVMEIYAMIVDREAQRIYRQQKAITEDSEFHSKIEKIRMGEKETRDTFIKETLNKVHNIARCIVRILEEQFPDFTERKKFIQSVIDHR